MEEIYKKSLQMIKMANIKNEKQYIALMKCYLMLNVESLKYISGTRRFKKIVKIANGA